MGAGGLETSDMVLNIGPQHPATHGVLRLRLVVNGERIVTAEPIVGYMHRGAEKLFEVRDYRQIMALANRHDWLSGFANELGVALSVEAMLGMEVPERATWIRTIMAELTRVLSHLMFLGSYPLELGAITPIFYTFREREELQAVLEEATGGRLHLMFNQVGGIKADLPAGWLGRTESAIKAVRSRMGDVETLLVGNEIVEARARRVGILTPETIAAYGVSGPIARASGVDMDLRRDEPYLAYGELFVEGGPGRVVTRTDGDALARLEGHRYTQTENPLGFNGYYLVSHGEKTPWRLKLRSASFNNVSVLSAVLPGCLISDMVSILGSMFFVVGDVDK